MKKTYNSLLRIIILFALILLLGYVKNYAVTIVLDPGHGGNDSGAVNTKKNLKEVEINYKIATYLKEYLEQYQDTNVVLTRGSGEYKSLQQRADVGFNNNADLLLSIHIDSAESKTATGATGYVTYKDNFEKYNKKCTQISNMILNNLAKLGIKNNGTKTRICKDQEYKWLYSDGSHADWYGIIRYCVKGTAGNGPGIELDINSGMGISAVLMEHCFIINGDEKYIDTDDKIRKIAKCDADALVSYFNLVLKNAYMPVQKQEVPAENIDVPVQEQINIVDISHIYVSVNTSNKTYTGKALTTSIVLKDGNKELKNGTDYTVSYKNNKNTGKATVTIKGKGNYAGTITKTFKIVPKKTTLSSVKNVSSKKAKVTWKKDTQASGYEVYMATSKNGKYTKIKTATSNKAVTYTKTKLTKKKTYYFKVRSYKTIDGKKVYSGYSSIKSVKIKK